MLIKEVLGKWDYRSYCFIINAVVVKSSLLTDKLIIIDKLRVGKTSCPQLLKNSQN